MPNNLISECKLLLSLHAAHENRLVDYRVVELLTQMLAPLRWVEPPTAKQAVAMRRAFSVNVMRHLAELRNDDIPGNEDVEQAAINTLKLVRPRPVKILEAREQMVARLTAVRSRAVAAPGR